jgi:hypothetical protein
MRIQGKRGVPTQTLALLATTAIVTLFASGGVLGAVTLSPPYGAGSAVTAWAPITIQTGTARMTFPTLPVGNLRTGLATFDEHADALYAGTASSDAAYVNLSIPVTTTCYPFCGTLHTWTLEDNWTVGFFEIAKVATCGSSHLATATLSFRAAATAAHGSGSTVTSVVKSLSTTSGNLYYISNSTNMTVVHTFSGNFPGPNNVNNLIVITFEASVVGYVYATCNTSPCGGAAAAEVDLSHVANATLNWISIQ